MQDSSETGTASRQEQEQQYTHKEHDEQATGGGTYAEDREVYIDTKHPNIASHMELDDTLNDPVLRPPPSKFCFGLCCGLLAVLGLFGLFFAQRSMKSFLKGWCITFALWLLVAIFIAAAQADRV
eukprot:gb/GECG01011187.1/.p1 GENE.gb/GECG01011187.1/~~gb/GECG01011187.1/.p1  ORF type:complete len:125 (+),score=19.64 gb/GECG01011187.1/:1-375(+)